MTLRLPRFGRAILSILLVGGVLFQALPRAATGTIMPSPFQTVLDTNGNPVSGAKICTFLAGTTTATATYTDSALSVANTNPIVADSAGRFTAYLSPGASYKFTYQDSTGTAGTCNGVTIKTVDNISAVPANSGNVDVIATAGEALIAGQAVYLSKGDGGKTAGQWFKGDSGQSYSSSTATAVGIAVSSIASGASGTVRLVGSVSGLSSLTIGTDYYIGSAGALTATVPILARKLGGADSTTSLVLTLPGTGWAVNTTTSVGTQNDFAPGLIGPTLTIMRCNNASLLTITGITGGVVGQRVLFIAVGAGQVDFKFNDPGSLAANKLINFITVGNTSMAPGSTSQAAVEYVYDSSNRWMMVQHEQGAPIAFTPTITFNSASVGQTYSSQVGFYYVKGKVLHYWGRLTFTAKGSSTGGAAIAGLPYTSNTSAGVYGKFICPFYANLATITSPFTGYVAPSATTVTLQMGGAASTAGLTDANFTNTSDMLFSGDYPLQ